MNSEESDSIAPIGASAPSGFSGAQVDVTHAPRPASRVTPTAPPARSTQRAPQAATPAPVPSPGSSAAAASLAGASAAESTAASPHQTATPLQESLDRINARLARAHRVLQLRVDAETGMTIAEIKNAATGQVLQQIPSADVVHLAEMLSAWAHGKDVLVDLIA